MEHTDQSHLDQISMATHPMSQTNDGPDGFGLFRWNYNARIRSRHLAHLIECLKHTLVSYIQTCNGELGFSNS